MGQTTWTLARLHDGKWSVRYGGVEQYLLDPQRRSGAYNTESDPLSYQQATAIERMLNVLTKKASEQHAVTAA